MSISIKRDALVKTIAIVRPALATQDYIPALKTIRFDGKWATAYNDVAAIMVKTDGIDLEHCVPGDMLARAVGGFGAESVAVEEDEANGSLVFKSGRSKIKLGALPLSKFPFKLPDGEGDVVEMSDAMLKAIDACMFSVSNDPTHPEQMGVTMDVDDGGRAVFYSTDSFTISRCATKDKAKLPGGAPVILPTFFCQQLLALSKAFPKEELDLVLLDGALLAEFGKEARLFMRRLVDINALDYPTVIAKHCDLAKIKDDLSPIPDGFDAAFSRALLVLGNEIDKITQVQYDEGVLLLHSSSSAGETDDELEYKGRKLREKCNLDPQLVVRGAKSCTHLSFYSRVLVLANADASFTHLIAHCSK